MDLLRKLMSFLKIKSKTPKIPDKTTQIVISSNSSDLISQRSSESSADNKQIIQQVPFFHRKNNLVAKFSYVPAPIYGSDLGESTPMGWLDSEGNIIPNKEYDGSPKVEIYRGYVIKYHNEAQLEASKSRLNWNLHNNLPIREFFTEEEFKILLDTNKAGEELLEDDVEKLKSDPNYAKPNLESKPNENNTFVIGVDPYQNSIIDEQVRQAAIVHNKNLAGVGIAIDEDQAEVKEEIVYDAEHIKDSLQKIKDRDNENNISKIS